LALTDNHPASFDLRNQKNPALKQLMKKTIISAFRSSPSLLWRLMQRLMNKRRSKEILSAKAKHQVACRPPRKRQRFGAGGGAGDVASQTARFRILSEN